MAATKETLGRDKPEFFRVTCAQCSTDYEAPGSCPECGMIFHY